MSSSVEQPDEVANEFVIPARPSRPEGILSVKLTDSAGNATTLFLLNGDIIATANSGPNAGKTVNLTYGKWA